MYNQNYGYQGNGGYQQPGNGYQQNGGYQQNNGYQGNGSYQQSGNGYQGNGGYQQNNQNSQPGAAQNQRYTFFHAANGVDQNGAPQIIVAAEGYISNPQPLTDAANGNHKFLRFSIGIDGRGQRIAGLLNMPVQPESTGRVWVRVTAWDQTAERLSKFIAKNPKAHIIACGNMYCNGWTDQNGQARNDIAISMHDWYHIRDGKGNGNGQANRDSQNGSSAYGANGYQGGGQAPMGSMPQPNSYQAAPSYQEPAQAYQPQPSQYQPSQYQPQPAYQQPAPAYQQPPQPAAMYQQPSQPTVAYQQTEADMASGQQAVTPPPQTQVQPPQTAKAQENPAVAANPFLASGMDAGFVAE